MLMPHRWRCPDQPYHTSLIHLACGVILGMLAAIVGWVLIMAGQIGRPHPNHQWVIEAWDYKKARAEDLDSPRLIVAGGSNVMFGIDSSLMEGTLGISTTNVGVNAGLGLPVILNQTLSVTRPGDLVVLALEYPLFGHNGTINHVMNDFYLSRPEELLSAWALYRAALPWHRWLPLVAQEAFQMMMQTSLARVLQGYRGLPDGFHVTGTYGAHHLDAYGDQIESSYDQREPWMAQQVVAESPRRYGAEHESDAPGWALLQHAQSRLDERGACLVLIPPAFLFHPTYRDDPVERNFYSTLPKQAKRRGLTYLGEPLAFMHPPEDMFDTDYHLVDEARREHTRQLIELLGANEDGFNAMVGRTCQSIDSRVAHQPAHH